MRLAKHFSALAPVRWRGVLRTAWLLLAWSACAPAAWAGPLETLDHFIRTARTGQAAFTQVVTGPARADQAARTRSSSGSFEFARPDRFRFTYTKPFEQVIVADGTYLWIHDVDLNQVTRRNQAQALAAAPAALVAAAGDLQALQRDYALQAEPEAEGLQWVLATPKLKDGQIHRIRIGFRGDALAVLEIHDSFGQRSRITFSDLKLNGPVAAGVFAFRPPAGADVVRQ